jgi:hypothetical protein
MLALSKSIELVLRHSVPENENEKGSFYHFFKGDFPIFHLHSLNPRRAEVSQTSKCNLLALLEKYDVLSVPWLIRACREFEGCCHSSSC